MTKPPNTPQTAPEEELNIDVKSCQRCGEDHNITFLRLLNPADEFAWWGTCYKTGQPVLLTQNPRPLLPEGEIIVKGTICERHNRPLTLACRKCNTEAVEAARLPEGGEGKLKELIGSLATRLIDLGIDSKEHTPSRKIESVWIGFDALRDFLLSLPSPGEGVGEAIREIESMKRPEVDFEDGGAGEYRNRRNAVDGAFNAAIRSCVAVLSRHQKGG